MDYILNAVIDQLESSMPNIIFIVRHTNSHVIHSRALKRMLLSADSHFKGFLHKLKKEDQINFISKDYTIDDFLVLSALFLCSVEFIQCLYKLSHLSLSNDLAAEANALLCLIYFSGGFNKHIALIFLKLKISSCNE